MPLVQVSRLSSIFLNHKYAQMYIIYGCKETPFQCILFKTHAAGFIIPFNHRRIVDYTDALQEIFIFLRAKNIDIQLYPREVCSAILHMECHVFYNLVLPKSPRRMTYDDFCNEFRGWLLYTPELIIHSSFACKRVPSISVQPYHAIMSTENDNMGNVILQRGCHYFNYLSNGDPLKYELSNLLEPRTFITLGLDGDCTQCIHATSDREVQTILRERSVTLMEKLRLYDLYRFQLSDVIHVQTMQFFIALWKGRLTHKMIARVLNYL